MLENLSSCRSCQQKVMAWSHESKSLWDYKGHFHCLLELHGWFVWMCLSGTGISWVNNIIALSEITLYFKMHDFFPPSLLHYLSSFFFQFSWYVTEVSVICLISLSFFFNCLLFHLSLPYSPFVSRFHCFCAARSVSLIHIFSFLQHILIRFSTASAYSINLWLMCIVVVFIYTCLYTLPAIFAKYIFAIFALTREANMLLVISYLTYSINSLCLWISKSQPCLLKITLLYN